MNLNQISLPAFDMAASIAFYETLGLRLIVRTDIYARFEAPEGDSTMSLYKGKEAPSGDGMHVYFECIDLDNRVASIEAKGLVFESQPEDMRWLWREAWLRDPAGNSICLFFAGGNRKNPPWRIG